MTDDASQAVAVQPSRERALLPVEVWYRFTLQADGREIVCVKAPHVEAFFVNASDLVEVGAGEECKGGWS